MRKLALLLAVLLALAVIATAYAAKPAVQPHKVNVCIPEQNWHSIWVDAHAVPGIIRAGGFVIDAEHPCPPDEGNYSPAPTPTQVPPGPAPNPIPTDTPENWLRYFMPVIYDNNLY